jgi:hypothetical protein
MYQTSGAEPDAFTVIYRVLSFLEAEMSVAERDPRSMRWENFGCGEALFSSVMVSLNESGYVNGVKTFGIVGRKAVSVSCGDAKITIKGLSYLRGDPDMLRESDKAKGLIH